MTNAEKTKLWWQFFTALACFAAISTVLAFMYVGILQNPNDRVKQQHTINSCPPLCDVYEKEARR